MSGPFGSSQWMYSSGGFYPTEIEQSLRFNDDDSAYLSRTPASAGNRKTWTWSGWVKRGNLGSPAKTLFAAAVSDASNPRGVIDFNNTDTLRFGFNDGSSWYIAETTAVFRDTSAWYHIVVKCDLSNATQADRAAIYVNGVQQTTNSVSWPNADQVFNNSVSHFLGKDVGTSYLDGYMAEVNFIDGQALDPTDFGEFKSGVWVAKSYAGSYGTNGFYLSFADSANIGDDLSGNANDWTANNLVATDVVLDSPTQNWCVANVLNVPNSCTFSNGNLQVVTGTSSGSISVGTFQFSSGKWYWELTPTANGSNSYVGIQSATERWIYKGNGDKVSGGTTTSYGASYTTNDIIGVAIDMDAGTLTFYKNGVSQGVAFTGITGEITSHINTASWGSGAVTYVMNFGQDSSFAGNKTAQGNTDDNGVGDFYYAPPSGFLALNAQNLPTPAIDPAQDDVPADYFNTVLYTGNGVSSASGGQAITGVGYQPDMVWTKQRSSTTSHMIHDVVRGAGADKSLSTNSSNGEPTNGEAHLMSFDTDGFTVGHEDSGSTNVSGGSYVAWNWLAANGTSSNTDGSITSTVSVNQKAGFSVVSYTGNGTSGATVGHGLGVAPELLIIKNRDAATNWRTYTTAIDGTMDSLFLNDTSAKVDSGSSLPTSTVFELGTNSDQNASGNDYVCYAFHSVEGYSKFGSYTGNGSTDGPFVYTGFRPAWVMIKRTDSTSSWVIKDTSRNPYNTANLTLFANLSFAEESTARDIDLLSNGFKHRQGTEDPNRSGTYIYMAFAENPFKYANAR